ncbi:hypothetical protein [Actinocorallia longicatena]|uniref:Carboxypeptidase regulatory-like domain-containing protein n=1 Tax=Actinocorallia longicatena TaxID=111803 RepID=A0ABP6QLA9_9ACTN
MKRATLYGAAAVLAAVPFAAVPAHAEQAPPSVVVTEGGILHVGEKVHVHGADFAANARVRFTVCGGLGCTASTRTSVRRAGSDGSFDGTVVLQGVPDGLGATTAVVVQTYDPATGTWIDGPAGEKFILRYLAEPAGVVPPPRLVPPDGTVVIKGAFKYLDANLRKVPYRGPVVMYNPLYEDTVDSGVTDRRGRFELSAPVTGTPQVPPTGLQTWWVETDEQTIDGTTAKYVTETES